MLEVGGVLYPCGAIRPEVYLRAGMTKGCQGAGRDWRRGYVGHRLMDHSTPYLTVDHGLAFPAPRGCWPTEETTVGRPASPWPLTVIRHYSRYALR